MRKAILIALILNGCTLQNSINQPGVKPEEMQALNQGINKALGVFDERIKNLESRSTDTDNAQYVTKDELAKIIVELKK